LSVLFRVLFEPLQEVADLAFRNEHRRGFDVRLALGCPCPMDTANLNARVFVLQGFKLEIDADRGLELDNDAEVCGHRSFGSAPCGGFLDGGRQALGKALRVQHAIWRPRERLRSATAARSEALRLWRRGNENVPTIPRSGHE
jgi:hypothetical protein